MKTGLLAVGLLAALVLPAWGEPVGAPAPAWPRTGWKNLQPDRASLQPGDLRGRVVFLRLLRARDHAANARTLDALARLRARYGRTVAFVAIETLDPERPEGAPEPEALLRRHGLAIPVVRERAASVRASYAAGPGPWTVLLDAAGVVRASRAARPYGEEVRALDALVAPPSNPLVGTPFGDLAGLRWLRPPGTPPAFGTSRLTLLRWWTTGCPHCTASVPDLARLADRYRARGLRFVGIYHRKSARRVSDGAIANAFQRLGGGAHLLAVDEGWRLLRPFMRRGQLRRATSISMLVDERGLVRWVHAGPRLHASTSPRHAGPARDLRALDALLDDLLPSASAVPR